MKLSMGKCWSLLIFDIIGLALSGYAFLLVFQVVATLPNASAFIILMGMFIGIKVIVLALYDLNRNLLHKNIPFIAAFISVIGNGIVFGISWVLMPDVPMSFFIGLTICDFIFILIAHLLWWFLIGKDEEDEEIPETPKSAEERKSWLNHSGEEESEYDSIFTTLLENEKKGEQNVTEISEPGIYEDEKRYQTSEFLKDIKLSLAKDQDEPKKSLETKALPGTNSNQLLPKPVELTNPENAEIPKATLPQDTKITEPTVVIPVVKALGMEADLKKESKDINELFNDLPNAERNDASSKNNDRQSNAVPLDEDMKKKIESSDQAEVENEEDFLSIERRLGYLFYEIEKSMEETRFLQDAVSDFHEVIETYTPITGDEKIIATGNLIREKLKAIVDKQFVVDEVLDDLIRLSKLINNRIDDLDIIEAGLNQRKMALDQKEVLTVEKRDHEVVVGDIEIMPEEVILENMDSEFIIAEGDYETIRKYLTQNAEK